jgi:hypothetical protein
MKNMTMIFTVSVFVLVAIYDVYAMIVGGTENSISHFLIEKSYSYPVLPFLIGVVIGHLFWRMRDTAATKKISDEIISK